MLRQTFFVVAAVLASAGGVQDLNSLFSQAGSQKEIPLTSDHYLASLAGGGDSVDVEYLDCREGLPSVMIGNVLASGTPTAAFTLEYYEPNEATFMEMNTLDNHFLFRQVKEDAVGALNRLSATDSQDVMSVEPRPEEKMTPEMRDWMTQADRTIKVMCFDAVSATVAASQTMSTSYYCTAVAAAMKHAIKNSQTAGIDILVEGYLKSALQNITPDAAGLDLAYTEAKAYKDARNPDLVVYIVDPVQGGYRGAAWKGSWLSVLTPQSIHDGRKALAINGDFGVCMPAAASTTGWSSAICGNSVGRYNLGDALFYDAPLDESWVHAPIPESFVTSQLLALADSS